jgi:hypothetical protein
MDLRGVSAVYVLFTPDTVCRADVSTLESGVLIIRAARDPSRAVREITMVDAIAPTWDGNRDLAHHWGQHGGAREFPFA